MLSLLSLLSLKTTFRALARFVVSVVFVVVKNHLSLVVVNTFDMPSVHCRSHGKVHPINIAFLLQYQFVKGLPVLVADIQQDDGIAQSLFQATSTDVYRTSRQVIALLCTAHCLVHCFRPIAAVDDHRIVTVGWERACCPRPSPSSSSSPPT